MNQSNPNPPIRGGKITVPCSAPGCSRNTTITAHYYNAVRNLDHKFLCKQCQRKKSADLNRKRAAERMASKAVAEVQEFRAPCGKVIRQARSGRCKEAGACYERYPVAYARCLAYASEKLWAGWRVV